MISSTQDRVDGHAPNIRDMEEFNATIDGARLTEVNFDGSPFTWINGRLWQRLDRVFINEEWASSFHLRVSSISTHNS